jgi:hypothetical protein
LNGFNVILYFIGICFGLSKILITYCIFPHSGLFVVFDPFEKTHLISIRLASLLLFSWNINPQPSKGFWEALLNILYSKACLERTVPRDLAEKEKH